jgi:MoaA/NifB/PqqE/SkfB family radical SAM enzyme
MNWLSIISKKSEIDWAVPPLPVECVIDTGNICNLECSFCPTGTKPQGMKKGIMTPDTFKSIIDKLKDRVFCYEMMNWGEPFLNPHFLDMISYMSKYGLRSKVDSNFCAFEFSEEFCEEIVKSGLWMISASIDGTSENTYSLYRIKGDYSLALYNLQRLCRAKERLASYTPVIRRQFLVHKHNEHEIDVARIIAQNLKIMITFMPMDIWFETDEIKCSSLHNLQKKGRYHRAEWSDDFFEGYSKKGIQYYLPVEELLQFTPRFPKLPEDLPSVCFQPFARLVVNWDGRILPCMHCYGDEFVIGNLLDHSLKKSWYNEEYTACRHYLLNYGSSSRIGSGSVCEKYPCSVTEK